MQSLSPALSQREGGGGKDANCLLALVARASRPRTSSQGARRVIMLNHPNQIGAMV